MIAGTYLVTSKKTTAQYMLRFEGVEPLLNIANSFDLQEFNKKDGGVKQVATTTLKQIYLTPTDFIFKPLYVTETTVNLLHVEFKDTILTADRRALYRELWETTRSKAALATRIVRDYGLTYTQSKDFITRFELCQ